MAVGVGEGEGAAGAGVPEGAGVGAPFVASAWSAEDEAEGAADLEAEHEVVGGDAVGGGVFDALLGEQRRAAVGEGAVDGCEGAGVGVSVGGGEFGGAPGAGVDVAGEAGGGEAEGFGGEAFGRDAEAVAAGGGDQFGGAGVFGGGEADVEVDAEWGGDFVADKLAAGATVDAADDFADELSVGDGVVAEALSGRPRWGLAFQRGDHAVPVEHCAVGQFLVDADEAGFVGEELVDGDLVFAGLGELGPVVGDGAGDIERAAVGEDCGGDGGDAFGGGVDVGDGVLLPGAGLGGVGPAGPEVDDDLAAFDDAEGCADLAVVGPVAGEGVAEGGEAGIAVAVDFDGWHGGCSRWAGGWSEVRGYWCFFIGEGGLRVGGVMRSPL